MAISRSSGSCDRSNSSRRRYFHGLGRRRRIAKRLEHTARTSALSRPAKRRTSAFSATSSVLPPRNQAAGGRPFHNFEIGSARRLSSDRSISCARSSSCASAGGQLAIPWTTVGSRFGSRRSGFGQRTRTVSAEIVLFAAPGRDDRPPRIPGGAAAWSFVGGVLALRSESVRVCAALAVIWPLEPGLSGGWTWAESKPVDDWRRDPDGGLPRGDRGAGGR